MSTSFSHYAPAPVDGCRIHSVFSGMPTKTRTTVVFLHDWGDSTRLWDGVVSCVASDSEEDSFQTVSVDFRGWGESEGPPRSSAYSIEYLARDINGLLGHFYRKRTIHSRIVLVGLAMGAKVAQMVAYIIRQHSEAIVLVGVVLVSPSPSESGELPPIMAQRQIRASCDPETASFVARNILTESWKGDGSDREFPSFIVEDMLKGNKWARAAWPNYSMAENNTSMSLAMRQPHQQGRASPPTPVLVLAAEKDVVEPLERIRACIINRIPGAELQIIPNSGHWSPIDAPDVVARAIIEFIKRLYAAADLS